jgi:hypothetical protein
MYEYDSGTVLVTFSPPKLYQARGVDTEVQAEDLFIGILGSRHRAVCTRPPLTGGYPHSRVGLQSRDPRYTEYWTLNTTKTQWDNFSNPKHHRSSRYKCITTTWMEPQRPGDGRDDYAVGSMCESGDGGTNHRFCTTLYLSSAL